MTGSVLVSKLAVVIAVLSFALLSAGQDTGSPTKKTYTRTGNEAVLSGSITFAGNWPEGKSIDMSADPFCSEVNPNPKTEDVIVKNGKLANVFIYVKGKVLDEYAFELPASPVTLEHIDCRYVPRVLGIQVGQSLMILNRDPTYHNTISKPKINTAWNQSQAPGSPELVKTFESPETFIPFKENYHPWEMAYVGVFSHRFFAVSNKFGNYEIKGLPPGRYTVVAWHERFGEKTIDLTLVPGEVRDVSFTFAAKDCVGYGCPK
jgi:cytochrome b involved in lipid metabolism